MADQSQQGQQRVIINGQVAEPVAPDLEAELSGRDRELEAMAKDLARRVRELRRGDAGRADQEMVRLARQIAELCGELAPLLEGRDPEAEQLAYTVGRRARALRLRALPHVARAYDSGGGQRAEQPDGQPGALKSLATVAWALYRTVEHRVDGQVVDSFSALQAIFAPAVCEEVARRMRHEHRGRPRGPSVG